MQKTHIKKKKGRKREEMKSCGSIYKREKVIAERKKIAHKAVFSINFIVLLWIIHIYNCRGRETGTENWEKMNNLIHSTLQELLKSLFSFFFNIIFCLFYYLLKRENMLLKCLRFAARLLLAWMWSRTFCNIFLFL